MQNSVVFFMWVFLFLFLFTWIFFPSLLCLLNIFRKIFPKSEPPKTSPNNYFISFIIAAHNEENYIKERVDNLLALNYPNDKLEIIIASDGSTDKTNEIVERIGCEDERIILMPFTKQRGRAYVHNKAVDKAKGDIVIFSDAQTEFDSNFLKVLLPHFWDSNVGCVSGRLYYKNLKQSSITKSADIYWKYEEYLRKLQSDLGILSFGSGAALAVRKKIYKPIGLAQDIDRIVTLDVKIGGYKVKYEPKALAFDFIEADQKNSRIARIRKTSRAFKDVLQKLFKINPFRNPMLSSTIFFHKTSRHLTPFYMIAIFSLNIFLLNKNMIYFGLFLFQTLFYIFALIGWFLEGNRKRIGLFYIPYNFVLLNIGRFLGVLESLFGKRTITYTTP